MEISARSRPWHTSELEADKCFRKSNPARLESFQKKSVFKIRSKIFTRKIGRNPTLLKSREPRATQQVNVESKVEKHVREIKISSSEG
jgi:hypothetical protein